MADMTIDDATADTLVTGSEKIPVSDGSVAKSVTVEQIRDFIIDAIADTTGVTSIDVAEDGIYVSADGEMKTLPADKLAKTVIDYGCALAGISGPNGNEIFIIDDSGTKKTITLDQVKNYITANAAGFFSSLSSADTMAASDKVMVKQGGTVKEGTLGALAAFALSTFASFVDTMCVPVLTVQNTDKIVVVSGGVTKHMTVAQLSAALETGITIPGTTTTGNIPTYSNTTGGLGTGLAVQTTVRAQGSADNNSVPTEAAVRAAIGMAIVGLDEGDVKGPTTTTSGNLPTWDTTQKKLTDGKAVTTEVRVIGLDSAMPTEKAVRDAITAEATARGTAIANAVSDKVVAPSGTTTQGNVPQWDSVQKKLTNGKAIVESVDGTGSNNNIPTEKAVRDAIAAATTNIGLGDVTGPVSTTEDGVPQWDRTTKRLKNGLTVVGSATGIANAANASDAKLPTEKSVRLAVDAEATARGTAITNAVSDKATAPTSTTQGNIPQWDSTQKKLTNGKAIVESVDGTGSHSNIPTEKAVRDAIKAEATARASAISSAVTAEATARDSAIGSATTNMVIGPSSTTSDNVPRWDSITRKLKDGLSVSTSVGSTGSDSALPTEKAVRTAITAEATARTSAISAEATARGTAITNAITAEATARGTAIANAVSDKVVAPSGTTTQGNVPQWDSTQKKLTNGKTVTTEIGVTGLDSAIPTEKAVRTAITNAVSAEATARGTAITNAVSDKATAPTSTTQGNIPQWDSTQKKLTNGLTTVNSSTGIAALSNASDSKIPTEKAVRKAIDDASGVAAPSSTTQGNIPVWDSTPNKLADGLTLRTSVRNNANASDSAVPTEKAVRDAVDAKISAPQSHTVDCIPTWGAANELKAGKTVVTTLASNGSNDNIPTEKAVRDAIPVKATVSADGLMSAEDKQKLENLVDTTAVAEIGDSSALGDGDVLTVLKDGTTWKKALLRRFWTYIMGKLTSFKLDDLGAPEDNTDLDASTSKHGLCPKFPGDTDKFLRGDGTFMAPAGTQDFTGDSGSGGVHGLVPAPDSGDAATKFLKADGTWAEPGVAAGVDIPGSTAIDAAAADDALICYDASENAYRKVTLAQILSLSAATKMYKTLFVSAGAMIPGATNPATAGAITFTGVKHDTMAFGSTTDQTAEFDVVMPDGWDKMGVKVKALWTFYNSTLGQSGQYVKFLVGAISYADGADVSDDPTTTVAVTDQSQSASELCRTVASDTLIPDGTVGNGNLLHFTVTRDSDYAPEGGNALPTDALLLGVIIQYGETEVTTAW